MLDVAERCGVNGVYLYDGEPSAAEISYDLDLQLFHRGHEGAGIASYDRINQKHSLHKSLGKVRDVFKDGEVARQLKGHVAIGHTRYGTSGLDKPELYLHPIQSPHGKLFISHNGTIAPFEYRQLLEEFPDGNRFDTDILATLIENNLFKTENWVNGLELSAEKLDGSYTCTVLTDDGKLVAFREPRGFKPLSYGRVQNGYVVASEDSALKSIGASDINPVRPGEVIVIDESGLTKNFFAEPNPTPCAFERFYFSRISSTFDGVPCSDIRVWSGKKLAQKYPVDADFVAPVPDSGRGASMGYSMESKIPLAELLEINREVGRIFILPNEQRDDAMRRKYLPIESFVKGRSMVITDDSIVRAETQRAIISILRAVGAKEVHVRITFPPIRFPCLHGGVAFASREELAINRYGGIEGVRRYINADSLGYISVEDIAELGLNDCLACVTGDYPLKHKPDLSTSLALNYVRG